MGNKTIDMQKIQAVLRLYQCYYSLRAICRRWLQSNIQPLRLPPLFTFAFLVPLRLCGDMHLLIQDWVCYLVEWHREDNLSKRQG